RIRPTARRTGVTRSLLGKPRPGPHSPGMADPRLLAALACLTLGACSGQPPPKPAKAPAAKAAPAPAVTKPPPGHIARANLERALAEGPPWLLRRVMREEALGKNGKFLGWRLTGLPEEWSDIDLKPGDIVSRVNDKALETPDDAWDAWKSSAR